MGARDSTQLAALGGLVAAATELVSPPVSLLSSSLCVTACAAVTAANFGGSAEGTGPLAHVVTVVVVVVATSFTTPPTQAGEESAGPSEASATRLSWLLVSAEELTSAELSSTQFAKAALEPAAVEEEPTPSEEHSTLGVPSSTVDSTVDSAVGFISDGVLSGSACLPPTAGVSGAVSENFVESGSSGVCCDGTGTDGTGCDRTGGAGMG